MFNQGLFTFHIALFLNLGRVCYRSIVNYIRTLKNFYFDKNSIWRISFSQLCNRTYCGYRPDTFCNTFPAAKWARRMSASYTRSWCSDIELEPRSSSSFEPEKRKLAKRCVNRLRKRVVSIGKFSGFCSINKREINCSNSIADTYGNTFALYTVHLPKWGAWRKRIANVKVITSKLEMKIFLPRLFVNFLEMIIKIRFASGGRWKFKQIILNVVDSIFNNSQAQN